MNITSDYRTINAELERVWKEAVVAYFNVLCRHFCLSKTMFERNRLL
jgi:hypothetical protein